MKKTGLMAILLAATVLTACGQSSKTEPAATTAAATTVAATTAAANESETTDSQTEEESESETEILLEGEPFKIGLFENASRKDVMTPLEIGASLAIQEINQNGGISGHPIEYLYENCNSNFKLNTQDAKGWTERHYQVLKDWGMQILIGGDTLDEAETFSAEAYKDEMFHIMPTAPEVLLEDESYSYSMRMGSRSLGMEAAQYIGDNNLAKKVAIIVVESPWDTMNFYTMLDYFRSEAFEVVDYELMYSAEGMEITELDFSETIERFKESGVELVFLPFYTIQCSSSTYYFEKLVPFASFFAKQASENGFEPSILAYTQRETDTLGPNIELFDPEWIEGMTLLTPFCDVGPKAEEFVEAYQALDKHFLEYDWDKKSQVLLKAASAYDSVYAVKAAAEKAGVTPDMQIWQIGSGMKNAMSEIELDGLTGTNITWGKYGDTQKTPIFVKVVDGVCELQ